MDDSRVDALSRAAAGLVGLGGKEGAIIGEVPPWWLDGHRRELTGRRPGRPKGAKDRQPRQRRSKTVPAATSWSFRQWQRHVWECSP
jgi:hypothetical protein